MFLKEFWEMFRAAVFITRVSASASVKVGYC